MKIHKEIGCFIHDDEATKMVDNYCKRFPHETKSAIFGREIIEKLLNDYPDCEGIQITFGANDDGQIKPILSAVGTDGVSLKSSPPVNASVLCPPHCP